MMENPFPCRINETESDMRGIKDGWYEVDERGRLGGGPYSNREDCLDHIKQQRAAIDTYRQWAAN